MATQPTLSVDQIKRLVVKAILSDDKLFENLVLKGGNAIDLIHQITARASVDIDFSISEDFPGGADELHRRVDRALIRTFRVEGYQVFDLKMAEKPVHLSEEMADFWGGYGFEFKLISEALSKAHGPDVGELRKYALSLGQGTKFLIDISRHEYVAHKQRMDFEGYVIYVYSPEMIVCEKLRAICQQMPEYGPIIRRTRPGSARARDFVDIYYLVTMLDLDVTTDEYRAVSAEMFERKRVPLRLLGRIQAYREFHRADFDAVRATISPNIVLKDFDTYFDFTLNLVDRLEPLWNV
ncbi:nucleotidyl transferase AbiEii/AbiGii toxin family protein [Bordetella bronchiseptica]|uniref:Nucleotidyl transferase AbiEii/AbiGii toxin family protein n=1 Tax=Bordetella bronchiseptica (strain ATCC BAA-588 / NCTC 13252 / RB50) TaxID=257310 RepID=A0A0H3LP89_BORBR|nr:nucleotidyl transferase AbiEii/AbiGii toxin family protein [Bordetella bronchiseptica]KAK60749.1 nucleotidyl transferase, PF08843 family [Bordetella bronchiseptica 980-2]KDD59618.1 nucleotidyl transferase, PF08843 family [Bordetella bronchiseptica OSU553]AMG86953.1 nucleotidyl transferase AbiEii/AbiGii toxin family protein [Bordetella bronchiseptica]KCV48877.1 nucleotidyl transferase, PF08843 family [Bordetella bronchiseptica 3E44]KCV63430.1 nucleotidyl transferase, PF08843 family [Bordetel